ncbi:unnamed protein product [Phaeothamnion confervicola]
MRATALLVCAIVALSPQDGAGWVVHALIRSCRRARAPLSMRAAAAASATSPGVPPPMDVKAKRKGPRLAEAPGIDLSNLKVGQPLRGSVINELHAAKGRKVWVDAGITRRGRGDLVFRVRAMICLNEERDQASADRVAVGQTVTVYVSKAEPASGRLRARLSPVKARPPPMVAAALVPIESMTPGQHLRGRVVSLARNAAFLDVGASRPGRGCSRVPQNGILRRWDVPPTVAFGNQVVIRDNQPTVLEEGAEIDVFVKEVFLGTTALLSLTLDSEMTPARALQLRKDRVRRRRRDLRRVPLEALAALPPGSRGTRRPGVVVRVRPAFLLVDVGARRPALVPATTAAGFLGLAGGAVDLRKHFGEGDAVVADVENVTATRLLMRLVARRRVWRFGGGGDGGDGSDDDWGDSDGGDEGDDDVTAAGARMGGGGAGDTSSGGSALRVPTTAKKQAWSASAAAYDGFYADDNDDNDGEDADAIGNEDDDIDDVDGDDEEDDDSFDASEFSYDHFDDI